MIRQIEALSYRCLRDVSTRVGSFQILVGPNASGKSTFLDVVALLGDLLNRGIVRPLRDRAPDIQSLMWMNQGDRFELAVELDIPEDRRKRFERPESKNGAKNAYERARYEVTLGLDAKGELSVLGETFWLGPQAPPDEPTPRDLFPALLPPRATLSIAAKRKQHAPAGWKKVVTKQPESGNDYFYAETTGWQNPFRLGPQRLALANLPEDEERFPVATWAKRLLMEGVQRLVLNSEAMRRPSPPGSPTIFQPDGSNLPWVIEELASNDAESFARWIEHLQTALPDLYTLETIEREEDKHRYLRVVYKNGLRAPSWSVSDGTLRLLAITLIAYLRTADQVYLIEEPENGIHPQAVEAVFQSLSGAYGRQVLCATHSPVLLSLAEPDQILCFARTPEGATDIARGDEHPNLREWKRGVDLGMLFAAGVLA